MSWTDEMKAVVELVKTEAPDRLNYIMQPEFVSANEETLEYTVAFPIEEWQLNPAGTLHGGACATAFDIAIGMGCVPHSKGRRFVTVDTFISYIGRMSDKDKFVVTVKPVKIGATFMRFQAEGYSKKTGKLIATSAMSYFVLGDR